MTVAAPARRPAIAVRRLGYAIAIAINAVMLYLINVGPGWEAVPFLTPSFRQVLTVVNLSISAGLAANIVYLVADPRRLRAAGDLATTAVGMFAIVRVWQVFPFDLAGVWPAIARIVLAVAIFGSTIGLIVQAVTLVRYLVTEEKE